LSSTFLASLACLDFALIVVDFFPSMLFLEDIQTNKVHLRKLNIAYFLIFGCIGFAAYKNFHRNCKNL
jgi:uncharacterized membrane protein YidH (DUF202 family)